MTRTIIFCVVIALVSVAAAQGSGQTIAGFEDRHEYKEKKEHKVGIKIRNTLSNSLESDDGIPLMESSSNYLETTFTTVRSKTSYWASTGFGTSTNRFNAIAKFTLGAKRLLKGVDVSVQSTALFSQRYKFGEVRAEISKTYVLSEEMKIRAYTNFGYFFPLQSEQSNVQCGVVSSTGIQYQAEVKKIDFDFKAQMILNNGAVIGSKRIGFNPEGEVLFPIPRTNGKLKFGPKAGFFYFPNLNVQDNELKSKSFNFGVTFAVFN